MQFFVSSESVCMFHKNLWLESVNYYRLFEDICIDSSDTAIKTYLQVSCCNRLRLRDNCRAHLRLGTDPALLLSIIWSREPSRATIIPLPNSGRGRRRAGLAFVLVTTLSRSWSCCARNFVDSWLYFLFSLWSRPSWGSRKSCRPSLNKSRSWKLCTLQTLLVWKARLRSSSKLFYLFYL